MIRTVEGQSLLRKTGLALAATFCSLVLIYVTLISWVAWSDPPFNLSGLDTGLDQAARHNGSVAIPIVLTLLTMIALTIVAITWRRRSKQPFSAAQRLGR